MSATTNSRAKREPITAPATMPALDGSSRASAEGMEGLEGGGMEKWVEGKKEDVLEEAFTVSSRIVSVLW